MREARRERMSKSSNAAIRRHPTSLGFGQRILKGAPRQRMGTTCSMPSKSSISTMFPSFSRQKLVISDSSSPFEQRPVGGSVRASRSSIQIGHQQSASAKRRRRLDDRDRQRAYPRCRQTALGAALIWLAEQL